MAPSTKQQLLKNDFLFIRLAHGELGLKSTFWRFGLFPLIVWTALTVSSYLRAELFFTMLLTLSFIVYSPFVIIGLIQSAKSYRGNKLWSHLTMFFAVFWMFVFVGYFLVFLATL